MDEVNPCLYEGDCDESERVPEQEACEDVEDAAEEDEDESDCYEIEVSNSCFAVFTCRVCSPPLWIKLIDDCVSYQFLSASVNKSPMKSMWILSWA